MPKPNPNETKSEFIERYMSSEEAIKDFENTKREF